MRALTVQIFPLAYIAIPKTYDSILNYNKVYLPCLLIFKISNQIKCTSYRSSQDLDSEVARAFGIFLEQALEQRYCTGDRSTEIRRVLAERGPAEHRSY